MPTLKSITIDGQKFDLPESGGASATFQPYSNVVNLVAGGNINLSQYTNSHIFIELTNNGVITHLPTNSIIDIWGDNSYTLTLPQFLRVPAFSYDEDNVGFFNSFTNSFYILRLVVSTPCASPNFEAPNDGFMGSIYAFIIM